MTMMSMVTMMHHHVVMVVGALMVRHVTGMVGDDKSSLEYKPLASAETH